MARPTLYVVRHGQTDWNVAYRLQGQMDIPINATGRGQAKANGARLAGLLDDPARYRFVSSPLGRTRETMDIVRQEMGLPNGGYETDRRIQEVSFGRWEGYTFQELKVDERDAVAARRADKWNYVPPGGESYAMLRDRVLTWLPYLDRDHVVVTHGGIIRVLRHLIEGIGEAEIAQTSIPQDRIYRIDADGGAWLD